MVTKENILSFWRVASGWAEPEEIEQMFDEYDFDEHELDEENLDRLSSQELFSLFNQLIYIVIDGIGCGDSNPVYEFLAENLQLDGETISQLMC